MVIDIVPYNGEEEMFELRYQILKKDVDIFYVLEFDSTFSGKKKEPSNFKAWKWPKVQYVFCDEKFYKEFLGADIDRNFQMEYAQREGVKKFLSGMNIPDDAIIFCSDVDEIWKPKIARLMKEPELDRGWYKLEQIMYYYFLNNRWYKDWAGTFVGKWKNIRNQSWNTLRAGPGERLDTPSSFSNLLKNAGWHFTNCMSLNEIKRKIESYSHQEYNTPGFKDDLVAKMNDNRDYYNTSFPVRIDEENWPGYLKANKNKYKHLWKEKKL